MKKYGFLSAIKDLFKYSKNNKKLYIKSVVFMLLFVIGETIYKTLKSKFLANMVELNFDIAISLVIACGLTRIFSITYCHNRYRTIGIKVAEKMSADVQEKLYKKILDISTNKFKKIKSGRILTVIKSCESGMIKIVDSLLQESAYVITSIVMLIIIYIIDFKLGVGITIICLISLYLFKIEIDKSKYYLKKEYETTDGYTTLVSETNRGINDIKALYFENKCDKIFNEKIENLKDIRTKRRILNKTINISKWTVRTVFETMLFIYIIKMLQNGLYSAEIAMLLITYMDNIIDDVFHRIIEHDFEISEFTANMKRVSEILDDKGEIEKFGDKEYKNVKGKIDIENLEFKYKDTDDKVLKNINIHIKEKSQNALVGLSGVGKTTIFKLLLKEFDNYSGKIKFDDIDINDFSKESFRNSISIVNQEPILFNMSIKENLLMAKEDATISEIKEACKFANIDEYIEELPNGYDEIISENSSNFSVGQKQRIAIARAILRNTPIILFDEATSALDNYSKNKIKETMKELSKNKTIIIISHTLDMIKDCNNIFYLDNGEIIEEGTHDDLVNRCGKYYELINNSI